MELEIEKAPHKTQPKFGLKSIRYLVSIKEHNMGSYRKKTSHSKRSVL